MIYLFCGIRDYIFKLILNCSKTTFDLTAFYYIEIRRFKQVCNGMKVRKHFSVNWVNLPFSRHYLGH